MLKNKMNAVKISFIIPAYNEEIHIKATIEAAIESVPDEFAYEIIVVDHGSQDATRDIVSAMSIQVLMHSSGTIASLRNLGVRQATGEILVFIDADVLLTTKWKSRFREVALLLVSGKRILTGSWVSVSINASWIERNWFKPLQKGFNTHINSGHMIISKKLFEEIGCFNEGLETGEDYEISMRAKSHGLKIIDDVQLEAVHEGYPKSIKEFFLRELWHGKGDAHSLSSIINSKVAVVSMLFLFLHLLLFIVGLLPAKVILLGVIGASILFLVFLVTIAKYKDEAMIVIIGNVWLYYIYFWARAFSLMTVFSNKQPAKHDR